MASRLFPRLFLPVCLALCFALALAAWPWPGSGGRHQDEAGQIRALREQLREERRRFMEDAQGRAKVLRALNERMRAANQDLAGARAERRKAEEEGARIQAETDALRKAFREARSGR